MRRLEPGTRVHIFKRTDEFVSDRYVGRYGTVRRISGRLDASVGESPEDPVYFVAVPFVGTDIFWREELRAVRA